MLKPLERCTAPASGGDGRQEAGRGAGLVGDLKSQVAGQVVTQVIKLRETERTRGNVRALTMPVLASADPLRTICQPEGCWFEFS